MTQPPIPDLQPLLHLLIAGVFYPLWLLAGLCDFICHRRTGIAATSGVRESLFHLVLLAQTAVAVVLALYLEITLAVYGVLVLLVAAHTLTSWWDTVYSLPRRHIGAFEQHVHGWLEVMPWVFLGLLAILNWPLLQSGDMGWRLRAHPWPSPIPLLMIAGAVITGGLPGLAEFAHTLRARRTPATH